MRHLEALPAYCGVDGMCGGVQLNVRRKKHVVANVNTVRVKYRAAEISEKALAHVNVVSLMQGGN